MPFHGPQRNFSVRPEKGKKGGGCRARTLLGNNSFSIPTQPADGLAGRGGSSASGNNTAREAQALHCLAPGRSGPGPLRPGEEPGGRSSRRMKSFSSVVESKRPVLFQQKLGIIQSVSLQDNICLFQTQNLPRNKHALLHLTRLPGFMILDGVAVNAQ